MLVQVVNEKKKKLFQSDLHFQVATISSYFIHDISQVSCEAKKWNSISMLLLLFNLAAVIRTKEKWMFNIITCILFTFLLVSWMFIVWCWCLLNSLMLLK